MVRTLIQGEPGTICRDCTPGHFPQGGYQSEGHLAVRLDPKICGGSAKAFLNGTDVSNQCTEVIPGNPGLVVLIYEPAVRCSCGVGFAEHVEQGQVTVEVELAKEGAPTN